MTRPHHHRHDPEDWAYVLQWVRPDGSFSLQLADAYVSARPCERKALLRCLPLDTADALKAQCDAAIRLNASNKAPTPAGQDAELVASALAEVPPDLQRKIADCLTELAAVLAPTVELSAQTPGQAEGLRQGLLLWAWTQTGIAALHEAHPVTLAALQHLSVCAVSAFLEEIPKDYRHHATNELSRGVSATLAGREAPR